MLAETLLNHVKTISIQKDMQEKSKLIIKGCVDFFSFHRASLFSYSSLSGMGEGLYACTCMSEEIYALNNLKENIKNIYPIHHSLMTNQPLYLSMHHTKSTIPAKYVKKFSISSLAIIPIIVNEVVVGFVVCDPKHANQPVSKHDLMKLCYYLKLATSSTPETVPPSYLLSNREVEVLQYLANGLVIKQMAHNMKVSEFTVRDYISSAIRKLGVNHRTEAVAVALRCKIII